MVLEIQKMIYDYKFVKLPKLGQFFRFLTSFFNIVSYRIRICIYTHTCARIYRDQHISNYRGTQRYEKRVHEEVLQYNILFHYYKFN